MMIILIMKNILIMIIAKTRWWWKILQRIILFIINKPSMCLTLFLASIFAFWASSSLTTAKWPLRLATRSEVSPSYEKNVHEIVLSMINMVAHILKITFVSMLLMIKMISMLLINFIKMTWIFVFMMAMFDSFLLFNLSQNINAVAIYSSSHCIIITLFAWYQLQLSLFASWK